nr:amino acid ABC transporter ATP-binding protein [Ralstonia sp.]
MNMTNANPQTLKSALDVPMIEIRGLTKSYGDHTVL